MSEEPRPPLNWATALLSDTHLRLCAAFAVVLALMPADGVPGLSLCGFYNATGAPCPGCGMTRSGSSLLRGDLPRSFNYHAFGPVLVPMIVVLGCLAAAPRRWRQGLRHRLSPRSRLIRNVALGGATLFLIYGVIRCVGVWAGWLAFPSNWL